MNIIYVGASGRLNQKLVQALEEKGHTCTSYSARSFREVSDKSVIVYGGRYLTPDYYKYFASNKQKVIYLSTYSPNRFLDSYQVMKSNDDEKIKSIKGEVIYIPFIREFIPDNLKTLVSSKRTNYSIFITSLNDLSDNLSDNVDALNTVLPSNILYLKLSKREQVIWLLISKLYTACSVVPKTSVKVKLLYLVKAFEKILHKALFCSGISSVFIKRVK